MWDLNDANFLLYAAKNYDNPHLLTLEFEEDIKRFKYIKRLLNKYRQTGEIKERLILNHIIILSNVFNVEPTVNMLFLKCDPEDYPILKTLLIFLNYMPDRFRISFNSKTIRQEEIQIDMVIASRLRALITA